MGKAAVAAWRTQRADRLAGKRSKQGAVLIFIDAEIDAGRPFPSVPAIVKATRWTEAGVRSALFRHYRQGRLGREDAGHNRWGRYVRVRP